MSAVADGTVTDGGSTGSASAGTQLDLAAAPPKHAEPAGLLSAQWRLFYGIMGYGALVSLLLLVVAGWVAGGMLPVPFYVVTFLAGVFLIGFVNYVIVKVVLRNFLVKFLEKFNPLVDQPLPKPGNPLQSTELDNLDDLFHKLMNQLAQYIASAVSQQTLLERLQRYFSPAVAQRLAGDQDSLEGSAEMNVTVLFADIRNFTRMSSRLEPAQVVEILNEFFTEMVPLIQDGGGTVLKLVGDEVMAVFGAPFPTTDDATKAVAVASRMHAAFVELRRRWTAQGLMEEVGLGIGINRGKVIVGNIGSPNYLDYTIIGDTVNLASRLTQAEVAHPGETIVAASVAQALGGQSMSLEQRPAVRVKGKDDPQDIFCVREAQAA